MVEQGTMTVREAGQLGGNALKVKLGDEYSGYYKKIGGRGHKTRKEKLGTEGYREWIREIGAKGGQKTAKIHGHEHYSNLGKAGGQKLKEMVAGTNYYSRIRRGEGTGPKRGRERLNP